MERQFNHNCYEEEAPQFREFNQFSLDDNSEISTYAQEEPVYRSISVMPAYNVIDTHNLGAVKSGGDFSLDKPVYSRDISKKTSLASLASITPTSGDSARKLVTHGLPDLLIKTNINVRAPIDVIQSQLERFLHETSGVSFELNESKGQWTVIYINGSGHCKFQITVYKKYAPTDFVIEVNRLMGCSFAFKTIYGQVKAHMSSTCDEEFREYDSYSNSIPMASISTSHEDYDTTQCLNSVISMAKDGTLQSEIEAARILCDLATDISMQQILVDRGCLVVLKDLICGAHSDWAKQHAVIALSILSDAKVFQSAIMKTGICSELLHLANDCPYERAELSRSAVHILANVTSDCSPELLKSFNAKDVSAWIKQVDNLKDERLMVHAARAKESLSRAVYAS
jgi:hypothetical protein